MNLYIIFGRDEAMLLWEHQAFVPYVGPPAGTVLS